MAQTQQRRTPQQPSQREHRPPRSQQAARQQRSRVDDMLDADEPRVEIVSVEPIALEAITKSEVMMQLDAAHKYPRSIARFVENATALCTMTKETAQSCIYALPRYEDGKKKDIKGPSIRLAEMAASSWTNLRLGSRIIEVGEKDITAQGIAWDLETNNIISTEVKRGIWSPGRDGAKGRRYSEDMVRVTQQAGISIALRNAIFRTIPRTLIDGLYASASETATGVAANTFEQDRDKLIGWYFHRKQIEPARLFARLGIANLGDFTPEHLELLIGWFNAMRDGETTIESIFGEPASTGGQAPRSTGAAVEEMAAKHKAAKAAAAGKSEPPPANDTLTVSQVVDALVDADESWGELTGTAARAVVEAWSPELRRSAHAWAIAFVQTAEDAAPPEQPEHTFLPKLEREPGEEG